MSKKIISRSKRSRPNTLENIRNLKINTANSAIFISGGLGDVIALESFMSDRERNLVDTIYYATNKQQSIEAFFKCLPNFPLLKNHIPVWTDFKSFWCFFDKQQCMVKLKSNCPVGLLEAKDYSIMSIFPQINSSRLAFSGSSLLKHTVSETSSLQLPDEYFVVCPCSTDKRLNNRDFNNEDWDNCIKILKNKNIKGVVLNQGDDTIPQSEYLIDFSNSCKLPECFEIVKKSIGYIGIDSAMSVLAAQLFNPPELMIKSLNKHCYDNCKCYYPKQMNIDYIMKSVKVKQ